MNERNHNFAFLVHDLRIYYIYLKTVEMTVQKSTAIMHLNSALLIFTSEIVINFMLDSVHQNFH